MAQAHDWRQQLVELIKPHIRLSSSARRLPNGSTAKKIIGNKTQERRMDVLYLCFRELNKLGFKVENPRNLNEKHVRALVQFWESESKTASTIQNRLSILRTFAGWIGKKNMVKSADCYLKDPSRGKRQLSATDDKSWTGRGVQFDKLVSKVSETDKLVALQLRLMHAFGLRVEEALMLQPHRYTEANYIIVRDGTKGGRERTVPIRNEYQREVLKAAQMFAKTPNARMMRAEHTLNQTKRRFYYILEKCGLTKSDLGATAHGLRHEYANDLFELIAKHPSPVRGGTAIERIHEMRARLVVTEELGHSRVQITPAYTGSVINLKRDRNVRALQTLEELAEHQALFESILRNHGFSEVWLGGQRARGESSHETGYEFYVNVPVEKVHVLFDVAKVLTEQLKRVCLVLPKNADTTGILIAQIKLEESV